MVRTCVTWDVLLVLLNPPQDLTSCRAGARPGHPISGHNAVHKKHCYSMTSSAVLDSLAWHPRFDPGLQHFDEVLVRERGSRALARGPGPEDERIRLHVLDDLLSRARRRIRSSSGPGPRASA